MIDATKPVLCGVGFKDFYPRPQSRHIYSKIVILDKTLNSSEPTLYQLNDPQNVDRGYLAFACLGTVVAMDNHAKVITLDNDNVVTYQHLLIASGPQNSWVTPEPDKEFAAGVHILMEALRLKSKKPVSQAKFSTKRKIRSSRKATIRSQELPLPKALKGQTALPKNHMRIYQVQL